MPSVHKVKINGKVVEVVGSGDFNDRYFVNRIFREAGIEYGGKTFDRKKYKFEIISSKEIKAL